MKKLTLSVVATAVLGMAAYTMAGAQVPERTSRAGIVGQGGGGPRGGPGFGRGGGFALRGLDLTDQQKEEIKAIRGEVRESRDGTPPAGPGLHRQLQAELFADAPDAQKLASLQQQIVQAETARLARQVEIEQKIAQVLTPEQRATVRERMAKAPTRGSRGSARQF